MNYIKVRSVDVILDSGGQGMRDTTARAWAVVQQDDPIWPVNCELLGIFMDYQSAENLKTDLEGKNVLREEQ